MPPGDLTKVAEMGHEFYRVRFHLLRDVFVSQRTAVGWLIRSLLRLAPSSNQQSPPNIEQT